MTIGFIGAGRVGSSLSLFFYENKFPISGIISRTQDHAVTLSRLTGSKAFTNYNELICICDIIFITVSDDALENVANDICENFENSLFGKTFVHTSGVHSSQILHMLINKGASAASLHPMTSVSSLHIKWDKVNFTLEGSNALTNLKILLNKLNISFTEIKSCDKIKYHTAACICSNYLVTLEETARELLLSAGFGNEDASKLLFPLISHTLSNYMAIGSSALTGPISRGDVNTVKMHLNALSEFDKNYILIYKSLGIRTVELALATGKITLAQANRLKKVLG